MSDIQDVLQKLHAQVAEKLLERIESGEAKAADFSQAIAFLKNNGLMRKRLRAVRWIVCLISWLKSFLLRVRIATHSSLSFLPFSGAHRCLVMAFSIH